MKPLAITLLGALTLTACAAPATRISTGLQRYGLDAERSYCVGTRLQGDLSLSQLQQLGCAAATYRKGDTAPGVLTVGDLLRVAGEVARTGQVHDPDRLHAIMRERPAALDEARVRLRTHRDELDGETLATLIRELDLEEEQVRLALGDTEQVPARVDRARKRQCVQLAQPQAISTIHPSNGHDRNPFQGISNS